MKPRAKPCKVCTAMDSATIDRLMIIGYGPSFIQARWDLRRNAVKIHRDQCLAEGGERHEKAVAYLRQAASQGNVPA